MESSYSFGQSPWSRYYQPTIKSPSVGKKSATVQTSINSTQFRVRTRLQNDKVVGEQAGYWQQVMDIAGRVLEDLQCAPEDASKIQTLKLDKNGLHIRYLGGREIKVALREHDDLPVQYRRLQELLRAKKEREKEVKEPGARDSVRSHAADEHVVLPRSHRTQQSSGIDPGMFEEQMKRSEQMVHHFLDTLTKQQELSTQERAQFTDENRRLLKETLQAMRQQTEQLERLMHQGSLNTKEERELTGRLVSQQGEQIRQIYELLSKEKSPDVNWDPLFKALQDITKDIKGWQNSSRADFEKLTQIVSDKENIPPFNPNKLLDQHTQRLAEIIQLLVKPAQEKSGSDDGTAQQVKKLRQRVREMKRREDGHEERIRKLENMYTDHKRSSKAESRGLQEENLRLKEQIDQIRTSSEARVQRTQQQADRTNTAALKRISELEAQLESMSGKAHDGQITITRLQKEVSNNEGEILRLREQLQKTKEVQQQVGQAGNARVDKLEAELEKARAEAAEDKAAIIQFQQSEESKRGEIKKRQKALDEALKKLSQVNAVNKQLQTQVHRAEVSQQQTDAKNLGLQERVAELETQLSNALKKTDEYPEEIVTLRRLLAEKQGEIKRLKNDTDSFMEQSVKKLSETRKQLQQAQEAYFQLKGEADRAAEAAQKAQTLAHQELHNAKTNFGQQLEDMRVHHSKETDNLHAYFAEQKREDDELIKALRSELAESKKIAGTATQERDELQAEREQLVAALRDNQIDMENINHRFAVDMVQSLIEREKNPRHVDVVTVSLPTQKDKLSGRNIPKTTVHIPNDTRTALQLSKICGISEATMQMILAICDPNFTCNWADDLNSSRKKQLQNRIGRR